MTDATNPFQAMIDQMQQMARQMNPALGDFSPKAFEAMWPTMPKEWMDLMFGTTANPGGLDARTRLMLTLSGLICQGAQNDSALRMTVRHLIEAGATKQHIAEAIGQMTVFAGVPATTRAMQLAQEVLDDQKDQDA
jgi:4-carboxymuconolactone decarboxylase